MITERIVLYKELARDRILKGILNLFDGEGTAAEAAGLCGDLVHVSDLLGFTGNLFHAYLSYLLVNDENSFSCACEMQDSPGGTLEKLALNDLEAVYELFGTDLGLLDKKYGLECFGLLKDYSVMDRGTKTFNERIRNRILELAGTLSQAADPRECLDALIGFYGEYGVGKFGLNKAFRIGQDPDGFEIVPITRIAHVNLSDLVGYESAKKKLIDNTEAFVAGRKANNCLLFGDAGTGKSSSVKGIMNAYYDRGLRLIEVYRHQFKYLNDLVAGIKNRNYRFIIYMDDLSFEDSETEYKYLKALIEGGLERKPDNILIYATSNRRHLIHENFRDKLDRREDDDIHESDTVQEKLSLYNRFGVTIYFGKPSPDEFRKIVLTLAKRNGIRMDEERLLLEANRWELSHGGLSGRTAQQFIDYVKGTIEI